MGIRSANSGVLFEAVMQHGLSKGQRSLRRALRSGDAAWIEQRSALIQACSSSGDAAWIEQRSALTGGLAMRTASVPSSVPAAAHMRRRTPAMQHARLPESKPTGRVAQHHSASFRVAFADAGRRPSRRPPLTRTESRYSCKPPRPHFIFFARVARPRPRIHDVCPGASTTDMRTRRLLWTVRSRTCLTSRA